MEYALYASLAANCVGAIGLLVMAATKRSMREVIEDQREEIADGHRAFKSLDAFANGLLDELGTYRANAEQVRRRAKIASDASAAKRRNGAAAPAVG